MCKRNGAKLAKANEKGKTKEAMSLDEIKKKIGETRQQSDKMLAEFDQISLDDSQAEQDKFEKRMKQIMIAVIVLFTASIFIWSKKIFDSGDP